MNNVVLKKINLLLAAMLMLCTFQTKAQNVTDDHFIYIQSKDKKPFYVILKGEVYSSSSIGYLIISKLHDGNYDLRIGFPRQETPEQSFICTIKNADVGYSLQKNDNGDLGLLDLQTQKFITSGGATTLEEQYAGTTTDNQNKNNATAQNAQPARVSTTAFSNMLADVSNDSTLIVKNNAPKIVQPVQENVVQNQATDLNNNTQIDTTKTIVNNSSNENITPAIFGDDLQTYGVIKSAEHRTSSGTQMTFVLFNNRSTDTVQAFVPAAAAQKTTTASVDSSSLNSNSSDNNLALFSDNNNVDDNNIALDKNRKPEKKFVNIDNNNASDNSSVSNEINNPFYNADSASLNNNDEQQFAQNTLSETPCDNPLSEKDFEKLQKKMIARNNDDEMIAIADKSIKGKCITTQQVKQLGSLFLSDAGRYAMYHDAYPNVSDKENYSTLQSQLLDDYFRKRFLDMLK